MMKIPEQLRGLRFNRVRFKEKRAFEDNWQNKPYSYDEIQQYFPRENYGVICGEDIRALDDDTPKEGLKKLYHENFAETLEVRGHIYFKFDNYYADKIIFNHPILEFPDSKGKKTPHMGELQGSNTYVVGPGSTHPSGEIYDIKKDLPIAIISYDKFMEVFGEFIKKKKSKVIRNHIKSNWQGDSITDIPIGNIISFNGLTDVGNGCFQGPHPKHGSDNGTNFRIDVDNNTWYCFRCQSGGGPSELIGVMEGIIECYDAGASCYNEGQSREVIKVAREKYGLSTPEYKEKDLGEVKGWANSISIVKMAKKRNFENCQICNNPFIFNDKYGMYYCEHCKFGGGLKKFGELLSKKNFNEVSNG